MGRRGLHRRLNRMNYLPIAVGMAIKQLQRNIAIVSCGREKCSYYANHRIASCPSIPHGLGSALMIWARSSASNCRNSLSTTTSSLARTIGCWILKGRMKLEGW